MALPGLPRSPLPTAPTVLATGAGEYQPLRNTFTGDHPNVFTHLDLNRALADPEAAIFKAESVVFIQCVGSRNDSRPYCSKICCTSTMVKALKLRQANPDMALFVLYRDHPDLWKA